MTIRYVTHENIDFKKWDRCIKKSMNGSIYGYSWYLNIVSKNWNALVDENYETVMPLPYRTVLGHKLLFQPHFASNLGVYSMNVLNAQIVDAFISAIPDEFDYYHINLNKYNKLGIENIRITRDIHYELDLIQSLEKNMSRYNPIIRTRLDEAKNIVSVITGLNSNDLIYLYQKNKGKIWNLFYQQRIASLRSLVSTAVRFRIGQVYGAYDQDNKLCAAALFVWSHQKATLLFLSIGKRGLKNHALEVMINEFIILHSEKNLTLRFEYASRKKFAGIYTGFGGRRYQFMNIRKNRLPWYLKFLYI